jgi:hypothetical protein
LTDAVGENISARKIKIHIDAKLFSGMEVSNEI